MDPIIIYPPNPNCCSQFSGKNCIPGCVIPTAPAGFFELLAEALGL